LAARAIIMMPGAINRNDHFLRFSPARFPEFEECRAAPRWRNKVGSALTPLRLACPTRRSRGHALRSRAALGDRIGTADVGHRMPEGCPRAHRSRSRRNRTCLADLNGDCPAPITGLNHWARIFWLAPRRLPPPPRFSGGCGPASTQSWQYFGNATAGAPDFAAGTYGSTTAATIGGTLTRRDTLSCRGVTTHRGVEAWLLCRNSCHMFNQSSTGAARNEQLIPSSPTPAKALRADDYGACATEHEAERLATRKPPP
jgi:hypothetical protein